MTQVEEFLTQTGQVSQLSQHLQERLEQCGWYDQVSALAAQELSASENLNLDAITQQVMDKAMSRYLLRAVALELN